MFLLCLLEWMLNEEFEAIEGVPHEVIVALIWFRFLLSTFTKWINRSMDQ